MTFQARSIATDVCPAREKLVCYSLGALPENDILDVAVHLEHCSACLETLNRLDDRADPLVSSLAGISDGAATPVPADERRILDNLAKIVGSGPARIEHKPPPSQVGPYEILEPLAKGGMGAVYKARHIHLGKIVALKLLATERVADSQSIARFMQEMKALGQLSHPNIVQAYDAGVESVPFLAMEFLEGMDLARLVKERGPLSVAQACECIRQAALALQHAMICGLVHRDIKPANLLLTPDGCIKVLDLGLARFGPDLPIGSEMSDSSEAITLAGAVVGTIDYIAPEQLVDSRTVDCRADLYSLGCTLYFLLTGVPPFGRAWEGNLAKRQAHLSEPSPNIHLARPGVPEELAMILERLLAKNPGFRFETPAELAAALQPLAGSCALGSLTDTNVRASRDDRAALRTSVQAGPPTPPSRALGRTLILFAFLLGIALGITFLMTRPGPDGKEIPRVPAAKALAVESLEMDLFRKDGNELRSVGSLAGKNAVHHDSFRITAKLSEPAYLVLLAYKPDGKAIPYTSERDASVPTQTLVFPREGLMPFAEPGMHAYVLLAARAPLSSQELWQPKEAFAWPKNGEPNAGAWKFTGQQIAVLTPGPTAAPAGFQELCRLFTARPGVDAVQAIAIAVQPDQTPAKTEAPPKK